jgi:ubiquitin-conjugating enzyme E2 variant
MSSFVLICAQAIGVVALADFISGLVHWLEDAYGTETTPLVGPLMIRPNIVHHHYPRHFTKLNWWQSSWDLVLLGIVLIGATAWAGVLTWHVGLFVAICVNANQIHKWSHQTRAENGRVVSFLQDCWILQTPRQHALHHTDPKNTYYCPITNVLNPALEFIGLWPKLEGVIEALTGATHRKDASNRGEGLTPAWVIEHRRPSATHVHDFSSAHRPAAMKATDAERS